MTGAAIGGLLVVVMAPGLAWSFVFLGWDQVSLVARISVSVGLSMVIVPLTAFFLNVIFGVSITLLNTILISAILTCGPLVYYGWKYRRNTQGRRSQNESH